jgi:predicted ATPase
VIEHIHIDNFRSLKDVRIPSPSTAFFCGPNGSGKTNIAEALDFLSKAFANGLPYAVAEKGGFFNMCFRKERRSRGAISFSIKGAGQSTHVKTRRYQFSPGRFRYELEFSLRTQGETIRSDFYVASELYKLEFNLETSRPQHLLIKREDRKYTVDYSPSLAEIGSLTWLQESDRFLSEVFKPQERELLYGRGLPALIDLPSLNELQRIRVYRLSPRYASLAGAPSVSGELGKFGENLPSALDYLANNNPDAFGRLQGWIREVIPNLDYLRTDYTQTRQMGLFVQEKGFGNHWYAEELSDGTLMSIALFLAVLDRRNTLVFIEEPENSLHPWILQSFLNCCREESEHKQVLISTQSPVVVAHATPENLFLVDRVDGKTTVASAIEREPSIRNVINHRLLDLGEYWLSGGLKAVPAPPTEDQENLFTDKKEE